MKQIYQIMAAVCLSAVLVCGCGSDGSSQAKSIIKTQASVTEDYVNGLLDAKNADEVIETIEDYTQGMKKLIPQLREFQEKFPEYQQGKMPKGMEEEMDRLKEASEKIPQAMMKITAYMMDPKVQAAMQQMGEQMSKSDQ
ncbi:MAG: hypothetical protein HUK40_08210 [Desulfobacter sp.]|nr:hypothetical protein [Desulfobacter sp.]WDP84303.1 MAG: hypothetical protein HUN05_03305 [Desulfobacter sp.]